MDPGTFHFKAHETVPNRDLLRDASESRETSVVNTWLRLSSSETRSGFKSRFKKRSIVNTAQGPWRLIAVRTWSDDAMTWNHFDITGLCERNQLVTPCLPEQGPVMFPFLIAWTNCWTNSLSLGIIDAVTLIFFRKAIEFWNEITHGVLFSNMVSLYPKHG